MSLPSDSFSIDSKQYGSDFRFVKLVSIRYYCQTMVNRLLELVERVGNLLATDRRKIATAHGLQPVHLQVADYLSRCNRFSDTPAAVAKYLGTTRGTTSQSLVVLERKGYLRKISDTTDRRVVHLRLTAKGTRLCRLVNAPAAWESVCSQLHPTPYQTAADTLEDILRGVQISQDYRTFGQCHTCRHLRTKNTEQFQCGLTGAPLKISETLQICHEHAFPNGDAA